MCRQDFKANLIAGVSVVTAWHTGDQVAVRTVRRQLGFEPLTNRGGGLVARGSLQETNIARAIQRLGHPGTDHLAIADEVHRHYGVVLRGFDTRENAARPAASDIP